MSMLVGADSKGVESFKVAILEKNAFIIGHMCIEMNNWLGKLITKIAFVEQWRLAKACKLLSEQLMQEGVKVNNPEKLTAYEETLKALKERVKPYKVAEKACYSAEKRWIACKLRLEVGQKPEEDLKKELFSKAENWMTERLKAERRPEDPPALPYSLSSEEQAKLSTAFSLAEYTQLVLSNPKEAKDFFEWVLVLKLDPRIRLEFPDVARKLRKMVIALHAARVGGDALVYQKNASPLQYKDVFLKVDGKLESLTDKPSPVLKKIYACFKRKNIEQGNFQILQDRGVVGWNSVDVGWYNYKTDKTCKLDVCERGWEDKLPLFEEISVDALERRYSMKPEKGESLFLLAMSKNNYDFDVFGLHGYFMLARPTEGDKYRIDPWGIYPKHWPHGPKWFGKIVEKVIEVVQQLSYLTATVVSCMTFVDESEMYFHRLHAYYPVRLSPEKTQKALNIIAHDLNEVRNGRLPFSFAGRNCFDWSLSVLVRIFDEELRINGIEPHELFSLSIYKAATKTPHGRIVGLLAAIQDPTLRTAAFHALHTLLGSWRAYEIEKNGTTTYESLSKHARFSEREEMIHPGLLIHKIKDKELTVGRALLGPAMER